MINSAKSIEERLPESFKRFPRIQKAILFGSRAMGTHRPGSDYDIAISGKDLNLDDILSLMIDFEECYSPYKFDIVILERINENDLLDHINRAGKVLYENKVLDFLKD